MASNENVSMALFCDFENVALGVRDANYEKFDIRPVLERLLLKGSIVVKKAYCDWDRYKGFKGAMHEANFELIEIPHVRMSGKNSADIRMVVDALDLCYTKSHVNTFVIISGDSDFSPLVSKLRENNKKVIGVGVKDSTSDLLVAGCDEFIFYDDLVRESRRHGARRDQRDAQQPKRSPEEEKRKREEMDKRRTQAVEIAYETFDALMAERGDSGKIWASVLKEAIKRRKPDFNEAYYGFRTFGNLLEEMKARGMLEFGRDEKSGAYVYRSAGGALPAVAAPAAHEAPVADVEQAAEPVEAAESAEARPEGRRGRGNRGGRNRRGGAEREAQGPAGEESAPVAEADVDMAPIPVPEAAEQPAAEAAPAEAVPAKRPARKAAARKTSRSKAAAAEGDTAEAGEAQAGKAEAPAAKPARAPRASRASARSGPVEAEAPVEAASAEAPASEDAPVAEKTTPAKRVPKPGKHQAPARSRLPRKPKAKAEG
ncbi:NYN domain-containing protein [Massilia endophytica]|uniref:NYN domain-containing protein n=1 Tax=Massilia endophytica TaxID=2899220 RepID=UPI001E4C0EC1|nr:NYN domain-containing protein [Massilia endophytica]UGQ46795.1 NYN domain-containing protein [Massilia endophytica]